MVVLCVCVKVRAAAVCLCMHGGRPEAVGSRSTLKLLYLRKESENCMSYKARHAMLSTGLARPVEIGQERESIRNPA